jgi:cytochrome c-type biogenesis protein CcmF
MASLGYYLLLAAFVTGAYAAAISVAGARRRSRRLIESGTGAFYLLMGIMLAASAVIVHAFVTGNYAIKYVQRYSDSTQSLAFKLTSYWGGLDGSIMFWVTLLAIFGSVAVYVNRERHRELIPYVVAVISVVEMFFLFLMIVHNNPFETYLTENPADGRGLSPLLQNFYMVIHPPTMYLGFVGCTIPYAFGMAALFTGYLDDSWLRAVRRWTMIAWLFLSLGLCLGMLWAYEELGWGGFWKWDPVENAGLLPWFTATAFLHSVMVQERRGMLRVWNVSLVIVTFFLTIFGTFMTRSGVVQSVHAFGEDPELARLFTAFMIATLTVSFGFVIYRLPLLRARNELDSWVSREAAFLFNNWILLFSAFFVLFATMFPTLSEAVLGAKGRITVGATFFNQWMIPIGLVLLVLTGIGPLLAWRKSTIANLRDQFLFPVASGLVAGAIVLALGIRIWSSGLCFAFAGFVVGTIAQEFWRGARVRQQTSGTDLFTAMIGLVGRNKRRYGGYLVHVGIVLLFLGFAGENFKLQETALVKPGQQVKVGDFDVRFDALKVTDDARKQAVTGYVTAFRNGTEVAKLYPARWFFRGREDEATTEVAIRRSLTGDLYIVMPDFDPGAQTATLEITVTPLINWVWFGFGVLAIGTLIALLPETAFAFAVSRVPANATRAAGTWLLLLAIVLPAAVQAQDGPVGAQAGGGLVGKSEVQRRLEHEVICMCGSSGCVRASLANCQMRPACHGHMAQTALIRKLVDEGKSHDSIIATFVAQYGQHVLDSPEDRGFNRLAWLLPYLLAGAGLVVIIVNARRWSHRPAAAASGVTPATDPALDARLDDELRDLD